MGQDCEGRVDLLTGGRGTGSLKRAVSQFIIVFRRSHGSLYRPKMQGLPPARILGLRLRSVCPPKEELAARNAPQSSAEGKRVQETSAGEAEIEIFILGFRKAV
jgi:hypothetical protein